MVKLAIARYQILRDDRWFPCIVGVPLAATVANVGYLQRANHIADLALLYIVKADLFFLLQLIL